MLPSEIFTYVASLRKARIDRRLAHLAVAVPLTPPPPPPINKKNQIHREIKWVKCLPYRKKKSELVLGILSHFFIFLYYPLFCFVFLFSPNLIHHLWVGSSPLTLSLTKNGCRISVIRLF